MVGTGQASRFLICSNNAKRNSSQQSRYRDSSRSVASDNPWLSWHATWYLTATGLNVESDRTVADTKYIVFKSFTFLARLIVLNGAILAAMWGGEDQSFSSFGDFF